MANSTCLAISLLSLTNRCIIVDTETISKIYFNIHIINNLEYEILGKNLFKNSSSEENFLLTCSKNLYLKYFI